MRGRKKQRDYLKFCFLLKKIATEDQIMLELWRSEHYFLHHATFLHLLLLQSSSSFWHLNNELRFFKRPGLFKLLICDNEGESQKKAFQDVEEVEKLRSIQLTKEQLKSMGYWT